MKRNSHKNFDDILEVKRTHAPVSGTNSYSVFKNGKLVLMNDGDRMSVFRPDDVETIIITGIIEYRFHRVGSWIFTGITEITPELLANLPTGCTICPAFGNEIDV